MMRLFGRIAVGATVLLALSANAPAYYYYVHFDQNGNALPAKWDLTTLSNDTVYFYVADSGLNTAKMAPGDGYEALVSELRAAANVWNGVGSTQIRIGYGGLFHDSGTDSNAGINVDFSDTIPPGLLAYSGVDTPATLNPGATFVPITASHLVLPAVPYGLAGSGGPPLASWSELFFTTLVHEFGHNLGLQHSTTSAAMSTYYTSGATKAAPLSADDIAGVSLLYPAAGNFIAKNGSITGKVTFTDGTPINLAGVAAISMNGDAVGAMTLPDGTYRIDGIPPGYYFVYAQALAPPQDGELTNQNIIYPLAADGVTSFGPTCDAGMCYFQTTFYPNATDWTFAAGLEVPEGTLTPGINIQVSPRAAMPVNSIRTFGYPNGFPIASPPLVITGAPQTLLLDGNGIVNESGQVSPGLSIEPLGWLLYITPGTTEVYQQSFVTVEIQAYAESVVHVVQNGARHILVHSSDNTYVLPAAVRGVSGSPPSVTAVQALGDGTVMVTGTNFTDGTRIVFDGIPAMIVNAVSDSQLIVQPPVADTSFAAHVEALNPDGQSSLYVSQDADVVTYTFPDSGPPSITVSPGALTAGGSTTVDVIGTNTNFVQGQTYVGFGTSNAAITNVNVLGPGHLQATVTTAGGTSVPATAINVTTGLSVISQALGDSVTGN